MSEEKKVENSMASLGGKAAAANMTATERRERAKLAAESRWSAKLPKATHGDADHPLRIGELEISCYVLDDGRRVVSQRGFQAGIGMNTSGGAQRLLNFVGSLAEKGIDCKGLATRIKDPIKYVATSGATSGVIGHGYEATTLADICDVILAARKAGALMKQQYHLADQCEILVRSFARVGIIALVDEATGYQDARERDALAKILEAFIAKELRPYIRTFEQDYYKAICNLKGWEFKTSSRRPRIIGKITNDLVYSRLAPGVLEELRKKNPVIKDGRREAKHFQWLNEQRGHPELQKHLARITGWMEMASSWDEFYKLLNDKKPVYRGPTLFDDLPEDA